MTHFGVTMFPTDRALSPIRLGSLVEDMGFESLFLPEHSHVPVDRSSQTPSGGELPEDFYRFHDPLESLATVAAVTSRIRLGTSTLVIPDHDPIILAKRGVDPLDHLSEGRGSCSAWVPVGTSRSWPTTDPTPGSDGRNLHKRVEAMKVICGPMRLPATRAGAVRISAMKQWPKPGSRASPTGAGRRGAARRRPRPRPAGSVMAGWPVVATWTAWS